MINIASRLFGDPNTRELNKLKTIVERINQLDSEIKDLRDAELKGKTEYLKKKIADGISLEEILPEAFAVVREAASRTISMRHFDVQLIGGMVLHQGKIAEMATGEGKTLVATLPAYLNALSGKSIHIVTVNDYLAKRDRFWMGPVYEFLGLKVGLIQHDMNTEQRKDAYQSDVVYGTNNEFGFDYLRDNMSISPEEIVQHEHEFAIIDEVDSILIDEARTPLIISGPAEESTNKYFQIDKLIYQLKEEHDYKINEKEKTAYLTEEGVALMERLLGVDNLYAQNNVHLQHHIIQALRAHKLFKRDVDYVVKNGEVIIVDEFTGRLMFGRRYSDGLHQAIEAKENVAIARESQTLATITFQNFFRLYQKLAGMTGTAKTEEDEFIEIYNLTVVVIPPNRRLIRYSYPDVIYKTEREKFEAVVREIKELNQQGRPVLVGTVSIEKSERLSKMLHKENIEHNVLNAKNHEKEAEIVAEAGQRGKVTISTNMAGRGTDIVLGSGVADMGGLHVIGTERHESRRIDNQLRGRAGRQGDPGSSRFFLSLEDDLLRLFGSERIAGFMEKLGVEDGTPIEHPFITRSIEGAQKRVEARHFEIRKQLLEFDNEMEFQRRIIYEQRKTVLLSNNIKDIISGMVDDTVGNMLQRYTSKDVYPEEWNLVALKEHFYETFGIAIDFPKDVTTLTIQHLQDNLLGKAREGYQNKERELSSPLMRQIEKMILLRIVDREWKDHLKRLDDLKQGIGLRAYGQKDPLTEYHFEAHNMFQNMIENIKEDCIKFIYRVKIQQKSQAVEAKQEGEMPAQFSGKEVKSEQRKAKTKIVSPKKKIGRNEPCPCGSGLKYKYCCGK
ncbi:MAG: preprotein translocase subunit SecA [Atribacterota bacterium]|nr:preprotein translocase subunit SecA [Atribacterota bacterium]MDD4896943.1 preprotein translocase subunit SecA [Atribacterota bacterium]MDD5637527.1 preprotein translocase subunit SecA [Atribacterota bacterium]